MTNAQGSSGLPWYRRRLHGPLLWLAWTLTILLIAYIALVIYRIPAVKEQQTSDQTVAAIQSQHLTMDDVDGAHLPPPPDPAQVDATVAGIDANANGIRDDVELAIFAKYPGQSNIKIRAAELQYAMTEQMFLTQVFDSATWKAVAEQDDRAYQCLFESSSDTLIDSLVGQVKKLVRNTPGREVAFQNSFDFETSVRLPTNNFCDLKLISTPT